MNLKEFNQLGQLTSEQIEENQKLLDESWNWGFICAIVFCIAFWTALLWWLL